MTLVTWEDDLVAFRFWRRHRNDPDTEDCLHDVIKMYLQTENEFSMSEIKTFKTYSQHKQTHAYIGRRN